MSTAFNLVDFDDGPTVVMAHGPLHTAVMDRRQLPPISGVMPIAHPARPVEAAPPISYRASAADATQPALRVRRDLEGSRRLVVALAIGFAFVVGIAGSFGAQVFMNGASSSPSPIAARAPRTVTDRSSSLDTRSTPDTLPHAADELKATPPKRKPATTSSAPAGEPEGAATTTTNHDDAPESLEGRDLLGEGLGN